MYNSSAFIYNTFFFIMGGLTRLQNPAIIPLLGLKGIRLKISLDYT